MDLISAKIAKQYTMESIISVVSDNEPAVSTCKIKSVSSLMTHTHIHAHRQLSKETKNLCVLSGTLKIS